MENNISVTTILRPVLLTRTMQYTDYPIFCGDTPTRRFFGDFFILSSVTALLGATVRNGPFQGPLGTSLCYVFEGIDSKISTHHSAAAATASSSRTRSRSTDHAALQPTRHAPLADLIVVYIPGQEGQATWGRK
jgi:hypothetical protein